jgi:hypothetical protein
MRLLIFTNKIINRLIASHPKRPISKRVLKRAFFPFDQGLLFLPVGLEVNPRKIKDLFIIKPYIILK